ncbi:MAG: dihydropteroate synthase [Syntrophomonadaceae bacterium]|nr:dihydropteroate synthase [Syntrophomonadaceae bacterium]
MKGHYAVLISDQQEAKRFMEDIGASPAGVEYMAPKGVWRCIKLRHIPDRAANIIKQEMLSKGGEAAVAKEALMSQGTHDVLVMGTLRQFQRLTEKLRRQPFGLKVVSQDIETILANLEKTQWTVQLPYGCSLELGARTKIMGIVNVTPDSFSDGGRFFNADQAVEHALEMAADGADIIDIGGASSRPGSQMVDEDEELARIIPVLERLAGEKLILSIDTCRAGVAEAALRAGAHIINDIGGLELDQEMAGVVCRWQAGLVLMHNRLQIRADQDYGNFVDDVIMELQQAFDRAQAGGIGQDRVIIDPGIGFGKTTAQNFTLLKRLHDFRSLGQPILVGASRKGFIGRTLDLEVGRRVEGSLAAAVMAVVNGASIVRVHDVMETKLAVRMADEMRSADG